MKHLCSFANLDNESVDDPSVFEDARSKDTSTKVDGVLADNEMRIGLGWQQSKQNRPACSAEG